MVGGALYYLMLFVLSLSIGIYNLSSYMSSNTVVCYDTVDASSTSGSSSAASNATNSSSTAPAGSTFNIFPYLMITIAISYFIIAVLSLFLVVVINSLSNMVPEDFLNIGTCKRFLGFFTKIFPPFFILIHYVLLLVIIGDWVLIIMGSCNYAIPDGATIYDPAKFIKTVNILTLVTSIFWVVIHYGGGIIRDILYQEPFMYSPTIGKPTFTGIMLTKVGP